MTFQAYLDNIHRKTGNTSEDFFAAARARNLVGPAAKAGPLVAWLKQDFGLGHGHAMAIWEAFKRKGWVARPAGPAKPRKPAGKSL
jgi:hypothetical protein